MEVQKIKPIKIDEESRWGKASRFRRRLEGSSLLLLLSICALIWPEATDYVLYQVLKEQFLEEE